MNSTEDDDYWNKSTLSKFNFEQDENKTNDLLLLEEVINTPLEKFNRDSSLSFNQSFQTESITNYLSEKCISCILDSGNEKTELLSHNLPANEEIRLLRRQLKERWSPPSVQNTINRILLGQPYSFELYTSLSSKKDLLKCAIEGADGNAILAVVVYVYKTLKKSLFYQLLMDYPVAVSHYIFYLYTRRQMQELNDVLEALGRSKEAMVKHLIVASQNQHKLQQRLRLLLKNYSFDNWDRQMVENYSKLVEWQLAASKMINDQYIVGESAVQTLKFNYLHKLSLPVAGDDSKTESQSLYLAKCFGISDKQSLIVMIRGNTEMKQWDAVEQLLVVKSWAGGRKLNTSLPIDRLLDELQKCGAPVSLLDNILVLLDAEKRIEVARRLCRHTVVIELLNKKKDKAALLQYMATLDPQSADYIYAGNILQTMGSKWKT